MRTARSNHVDRQREAVRRAILEAVAQQAAERGVGALTMSGIADHAGIGRATLYRYFPDLDSVLVAWHEDHIRRHLAELTRGAARSGTAAQRIESALDAYALMSLGQDASDVAAALHRGHHAVAVQQQLIAFLTDLITDGVAEGAVRDDIPPPELALYCLGALGAVPATRSRAAARRLVTVTLSGLWTSAPPSSR